jgi:plastocyanin
MRKPNEDTMVKVGDVVTWRNAEKPHALGFTGCKVLELGHTEDGRPAAKLDLGHLGEANALVSDLTVEADGQ